jgi:hypothetical protein
LLLILKFLPNQQGKKVWRSTKIRSANPIRNISLLNTFKNEINIAVGKQINRRLHLPYLAVPNGNVKEIV